MNIRAIIFDIYNTLLHVGPPPPDADARWQRLWRDLLHMEPRLTRLDFSVAASKLIARHHEAGHVRGIRWPEVHWPSIVTEVVPELARLPRDAQEAFIIRQIRTGHTTHVTAETAATLRWLKGRQYLLGIASNAQSYTLRELKEEMAFHALEMDMFTPDLSFWSFEHGFSKPDPHVFQILTVRLAALGISPPETLIIGDRLDNDIEPARAFGWQTWQLAQQATGHDTGDWKALLARLQMPY